MSSHVILVTGATGTQGGAVARCLLRANQVVHALVRNPTSAASLALQSLGAILFQGTFDDPAALKAAATSCTGMFLNLSPSFTGKSEIEHAQIVLSVARAAGVKHVIYSSGTGINLHDKLVNWEPKGLVAPHILAKYAIEDEVRKGGWETWTILRPGNFMTNFLLPSAAYMFPDLVGKGLLLSAYKPDTKLLLINPDDVGPFATAAFFDPQKFHEKEIEIFGDVLGVQEVAETLAKATGKKIEAKFQTEEEVEVSAATSPIVAGQRLLVDLHKWVDIDGVKKYGIQTRTFAQFLEEKKERVTSTFEGLP